MVKLGLVLANSKHQKGDEFQCKWTLVCANHLFSARIYIQTIIGVAYLVTLYHTFSRVFHILF